MVVLAAVAAATGCGGRHDRPAGAGATTTTTDHLFTGTGPVYPKHLHQPPTND